MKCLQKVMLRGALSAPLDLEDDIQVVGQAENGEEALRLITKNNGWLD